MATKNPFVNEFGEISNELLLNIAEILVLRLPEGTERVIASKWLKKFLRCKASDYKHNLSLFVCSLTKQMLVEPFDKPPRDLTNSQWRDFEREYTQKDINDAVIQRLYKDSLTPPYKIDISEDLHEYSCFQEIPFFGAHFYYAFSPRDKIDKWAKFNKLNVPRNLVEKLVEDEPLESPIKGRNHSKARPTTSSQRGVSSKIQRPEWQGVIEEEPEPQPQPLKSMISIPIDTPGKPIPLKLQRRMSAAAEKSRILKDKKIQGSSSKSTNKSNRVSRVDDIDSQLIAAASTPLQPQQPKSPPMPEFTGAFADIQKRLYSLRKSNPPPELIQTTREMSLASEALNEEAERIGREKTANITNAARIEKNGVNIGSNILKIMRSHQAGDIQNAAENASAIVESVQMTMQQLDEILSRNVKPSNDTIRRLEAIKLSMRSSAIAAANISNSGEDDEANQLVNKLNGISNVHHSMAESLKNIEPANEKDAILIEGLESKNYKFAATAKEAAKNLSNAIINDDSNLENIINNASLTVDQILDLSFSDDDEYMTKIEDLTPDVRKVVEIERKEHEKQLNQTVERQFSIATSTPAVARHMKFKGDFGGTIKKLPLIDDEDESLFNISDEVIKSINQSIEEIEGSLIPELENEKRNADNENHHEVFSNAIEELKDFIGDLDKCLDIAGEINESLIAEKSLDVE